MIISFECLNYNLIICILYLNSLVITQAIIASMVKTLEHKTVKRVTYFWPQSFAYLLKLFFIIIETIYNYYFQFRNKSIVIMLVQ